MIEPPADDLLSAVDGRRGARIPHARPESELTENLAEMGQQLAEDYQEVDFRRALDGLLIRFDPSAAFAPGSATVPPALRDSLVELAEVLEHYRHTIVVEGHTDSRFEPTPGYPTELDLSVARASAAAQVLLESSTLSPEVVQVAGLGSTRPIGDSDTVAERTRDRRVDVRVLALSNARAASLDARERRERAR